MMEDATWCYLREEYYPQFRNNVVQLSWDVRFKLLRELYDAEGDLPWEIRSSDPVADMMNWVAKKGDEAYFTFFCKGTQVNKDGGFRLHRNISRCLGERGLYSPYNGNS